MIVTDSDDFIRHISKLAVIVNWHPTQMKVTILNIILLFLFRQLCYGQKTNGITKMEHSDRYKQGWEKLKEIDGKAGEKAINGLKGISPDLGKFIIEYAFGDIYSRDGLDLK